VELVTGGTGYVGNRLLRRLAAEGRPVRALARRPELLPEVEVVRGDLLTGAGLEEALDGCSTAYYLVHSMEPATNGDFAGRDRRMAEAFGEAAARAGVERIVYLGGIVPQHHPLSPHLGSRLEVERTLLAAVPGSTALRASIVIGAGSSSFRLLVRLVERLRVLPMPRWRKNRTAPIDERDVIEFLARTPQDRANRRRDGGRAPAAGSRPVAHAARQRGGRGRDRPADRAGAPTDGEPRNRPVAARPG
jgi:uncharacterized protein YbjT (DUF2867 family)